MKKTISLLSLLLLLLTAGCASKVAVNDSDTIAVEAELTDEEQIREKVAEWDRTLNETDTEGALALYAERVWFYTTEYPRERCVAERNTLALHDPRFHQIISSVIEVEPVGHGLMRARFTKVVDTRDGTFTYPSYLIFQKIGGDWKIIKESDKVTDDNVRRRHERAAIDSTIADTIAW